VIHNYYAIWDNCAKKYVHVTEGINDDTVARMCEVMAKDKTTFIGQKPDDFRCDMVGTFDDETGGFISPDIMKHKVWEGHAE